MAEEKDAIQRMREQMANENKAFETQQQTINEDPGKKTEPVIETKIVDDKKLPSTEGEISTEQDEKKSSIDEDSVLKFLSEKRGMTFSSVDDIFKKEEPESPFANEEIAKINKFAKETGRGIDDYFKLNEDLETKDDITILREAYLSNGGLSSDFEIEYDLDLQELSEEDGYTEAEIKTSKREIHKRNLRVQKEAKEVRNSLNELKTKLNQPIDGFKKPVDTNAGLEHWKNGVSEAAQNFDLGIEGYEYTADPKELTERYSTLESILDSFRDEKGVFNHSAMIKSFEISKNIESIVNAREKQAAAKAEEALIKKMENPGETSIKISGGENADPEEQAMRKKLLGKR